MSGRRVVAVVGGGAAGVLASVALLRRTDADVVLIESGELGGGVAYGASARPWQLLNSRAGAMSAYPDDPGHFVRWAGVEACDFMPRRAYGHYLREVLDWAALAHPGRFRWVRGRVSDVRTDPLVILDDGREVRADDVVLALGNPVSGQPPGLPSALGEDPSFVADPWRPGALDNLPHDRPVLLIGTGLTAVDVTLTLAATEPARTPGTSGAARTSATPPAGATAHAAGAANMNGTAQAGGTAQVSNAQVGSAADKSSAADQSSAVGGSSAAPAWGQKPARDPAAQSWEEVLCGEATVGDLDAGPGAFWDGPVWGGPDREQARGLNTTGASDRVIIAYSRRGMLPLGHVERPADLDFPDLTGKSTLREIIRAVRESASTATDWRAVVDGLRPQTDAVWGRLADRDRDAFLRHLARLWECHRHRMAPPVAARIAHLRETGRLIVRKGAPPEGLPKAAIVNCAGPGRLPGAATGLTATLLRKGLARVGPYGLGLDVDHDGRIHRNIWVLGPLRRGVRWETTAVPEIRSQARDLAEEIATTGLERAA
ncbi:FAD/NAD(P)-binding protein [Actinoplanes sp. NPDC089786]|uniref:FAD/NAD(P)-binding protein n=1 Tax=Actinoplanes sp. NPDC089786 TaxID=3155185 RepID=UPI00341E8C7A